MHDGAVKTLMNKRYASYLCKNLVYFGVLNDSAWKINIESGSSKGNSQFPGMDKAIHHDNTYTSQHTTITGKKMILTCGSGENLI